MRRLLIAAALGATLLISAGCAGQDNEEPATQPTTVAPTSASPTPSPSADYAVDTKKICTEIDKALETDMEKFGVELGKMIAYKQAGNTSQANAARAAAQAELTAIADRMRTRTAAALDPELKAAGEESAKNIAASAADETFFSKLKSINDVQTVLQKEAIAWLVPLATLCA